MCSTRVLLSEAPCYTHEEIAVSEVLQMDQSELELERRKQLLIDQLTGRFSNDHISMEVYESAVEDVNAAGTIDELSFLSQKMNLPAIAQRAPEPMRPPAEYQSPAAGELINFGSYPQRMDKIAIFSGSETNGMIKMAPKTSCISVFGGLRLDLRKAIFPPGETVIDVVAVFGGVDIVLPEGVNYSVGGFAIFGGFSSPRGIQQADEHPGAPTVRIQGIALFGGTDVKIRRRK
jgi:hypothetical protein